MPEHRTPAISDQDRAERAVLACVLMRPDTLLDLEDLVEASFFTSPGRAGLWELMVEMNTRGQSVDLASLAAEGQRKWPGRKVATSLAALSREDVSPSSARTYGEQLRSLGLLRRAREALQDGLSDLGRVPLNLASTEEFLNGVSSKLDASSAAAQRRESSLADAMAEAFSSLEEERDPGIRTKFHDLDDTLGGLRPGKLIVLAARPSMGKSAFAMGIGLNVSMHTSHPDGRRSRVMFYSLEMPRFEIMERVIASRGDIEMDHIMKRRMSLEERQKAQDVAQQVMGVPFTIGDSMRLTTSQIRTRLRKARQDGEPIDVVIVDYLQLLSSPKKVESRNLEVGEFSRSLKSIALEFDCTVLALSQLNRSVEARGGDRPALPRLSDLRDSGSLEQDADIVLFLYRQQYYDAGHERPHDATVIVAKNRGGPTGEVTLLWRGPKLRFDNTMLDEQSVPMDLGGDF